MIIKQGRTNWNYILIVFILAVVVGGGALGCRWWAKKQVKAEPNLEILKEMQEGITVFFPTEGATWVIGETYEIRWTPTDPTGKVGIILSDTRYPSASISRVWQKELIPNTGSYSFIVSDMIPEDLYQMYISTEESHGYSNLFSIISNPADL